MDHGRDVRHSVTSLLRQLYRLVLEGQVNVVRKALKGLPAGLPRLRFVVVTIALADVPPDVEDRLDQVAADPARRVFRAVMKERMVLLVDDDGWPEIQDLLIAGRLRCGVSSIVGWSELSAAVAQSTRAWESAGAGRCQTFDELVNSSLAGLVSTSAAADIARGRLSPVLSSPEGPRLLLEAGTWLRHNGQWEPAALELSMHRHTLKARMTQLGDRMDLRLELFSGRAELWLLLTAAGLVDEGPGAWGIR